ncbi:MAG: hypothetical protein QOI86_1840 [Actinomycetota bacterium]|nr:hypothetical protein [Actinomycetota bacterium]
MKTAIYRVTGMTCDHCVRAVTEEVSKLAGVSDVAVDLTSGTLTVSSEMPLDAAILRAAVDEAGFQLAF